MKKWHVVGIGLIGLLLVAGGPSPAWAGACAVSVTGDTRGDIFAVIQGGNNVLQYTFADLDGTGAATCTSDCFDTDGDSLQESAADGHSSVLPFSPTGGGELSDNLDANTSSTGNRFPGLASSGSTTFQPVPGSPTFPSTGNLICIAVSNEKSVPATPNTEIWILGLDGQGNATQCVFDLDGNQTFIEPRSAAFGDLDDDGWRGLSTATPCGEIN